jgi:Uma2 family endonuclease
MSKPDKNLYLAIVTATSSHIKLKHPPRTAVEVFEMLPEGTLAEVINNTIYMSPSPTFQHQDTSMELGSAIHAYAKEKKLGKCIASPVDVYLDKKNIVQPDILFISTANLPIIKDNKIKGVPDLVIEILSINRKYDLEDKKNLYERFGVKEYFIVDPISKETFSYYHDGEKYILEESKKGRVKSKLLKKTFAF